MLRRRLHEPAERGGGVCGERGAVEQDLAIQGLRFGMTFLGCGAEQYDPILPRRRRGTVTRSGTPRPPSFGRSSCPFRGGFLFTRAQNFTPTVPNTVRPGAIVA